MRRVRSRDVRGCSLTWILFTVCVWLGFAQRAEAWIGDTETAAVHRLRVDGAPELLSHRNTFACDDERLIHCRGESRWVLPASDETRRAVLYLDNGTYGTATVDGRAVPTIAEDPSLAHVRLEIELPASTAPIELVVPIVLGPRRRAGCGMGYVAPLVEQRHRLTSNDRAVFIELDVESYDLEDDPPQVQPIEPRTTITYLDRWMGPSGETASTTLRLSRWQLKQGPLFAVGAGFHGKSKTARPWFRAGYEVGSLPFLLHAVTAESDLRRITVVPATEIGTGSLWGIIPAISVGVGAPVRVLPKLRPGVRAQAALSFPYLAVIGSFDSFPTRRPGQRSEYVGNIGLQASF